MLNILSNSIRTLISLMFLFCLNVNASVLDDALTDDIADLCDNRAANELFKIANKNSNTDELRRSALNLMIEASGECASANDTRLRQYHQKMITAAHKVLDMPDIESRQVAVEALQYVIMLPDEIQPSEGAISRGQTIANVALNDVDVNIRMWALEALVTLRGSDVIVQQTLQAAINDNETIVSDTANEMLIDYFGS